MSDKTRRPTSATGSGRHQPSRLQRRAPSSLQISRPASHWNVAIPLLSPLAASPTSPELTGSPAEAAAARPREATRPEQERKPVAFKKWQHPAAPFCYDPAPLNPSFVPV